MFAACVGLPVEVATTGLCGSPWSWNYKQLSAVQHGFWESNLGPRGKSSKVSIIELPPPAIAFSLPPPLNARLLVLDKCFL